MAGTAESRPYSPLTRQSPGGTRILHRAHRRLLLHNFDQPVGRSTLPPNPQHRSLRCGWGGLLYRAPGGLYTYQFGHAPKMPAVKFMWYEGRADASASGGLEEDDQLGRQCNGILFIGDKGIITCGGWGGRPSLLPGSKDGLTSVPAKTLPRSKGHHRDWLDACKGGTPASGNFEYGAALRGSACSAWWRCG